MTSPKLIALSSRQSNEAVLRGLALDKVNATKVYNDVLYSNTTTMSDDQLVDRELELVRVRKAMFAAIDAFDKAV